MLKSIQIFKSIQQNAYYLDRVDVFTNLPQ